MTKRPSLADSMKAFAEPPTHVAQPIPAPIAVSPPAPAPATAPATGRAKSRAGMKLLLTPVEPSIHKRLKLLAVQQDSTMEAAVRTALLEYLERNEK